MITNELDRSREDDQRSDHSAGRPRLVLIDDIAALRTAIPVLMPGFHFVASYPGAEELLTERPSAELVLLDLKLAHERRIGAVQGLAAVAAVHDAGYRICLYSQEERPFVLAACVAAGASGLVTKTEPLDVVEETISRVLAGETVLPDSLVGLAEKLLQRGNLRLLSQRQRQLLFGRARGHTYAEIAADLHLSESTLRGYWADLCGVLARYLRTSSPADIEQALGLAPGDLLGPGW